jgi:small conductance mechanosensitive channel
MLLLNANSFSWEDVMGFLKTICFEFGPKLIVACIILWAGFKLIKFLVKKLEKGFEKKNLDLSLRPFLISLISILLKVLLILTVIGYLGVEMTQFTAILASCGVAIGLALSGTLQNVAGGVVLLVLRPFKVGDYIEAQGYEGTVKEIMIFTTTLVTVDNKVITIPNGALSGSSVINYSKMEDRRIDIKFNLAHGVDISQINPRLIEIAKQDKRIFSTPEPTVIVSITDLAINVDLRFWCKNADYWNVMGDIHTAVYNYLVSEKISLPHPKLDLMK